MPRRTQTQPKSQPTARTATATATETAPASATDTTATQALLDDTLLDEIDAVLEENAMEVVKRYIQKGGQ